MSESRKVQLSEALKTASDILSRCSDQLNETSPSSQSEEVGEVTQRESRAIQNFRFVGQHFQEPVIICRKGGFKIFLSIIKFFITPSNPHSDFQGPLII